MNMRRLLVLVAALVVLAAPAVARADTVTDWNVNASNALFNTAAQAPTVGSLHMAMVHGAMYDAVNAIDGRYEPYVFPGRRGAFWASKDAAAATAAYRVLSASSRPSRRSWSSCTTPRSPHSPIPREVDRDRHRWACGGGDDRRAHERRPLRRAGVPDRALAGAVASGPARRS